MTSAPVVTLVVLLAIVTSCERASTPRGDRRLVVVGVDGATWSIISPMMEQGRLPHLAGLYSSGSAGQLRSLEPMVPAALWTTIITGKSRGVHGIDSATEKIAGRYAARPVTGERRRAPALWTIAGTRGLSVGVSHWPLTFPVETVNGFMVADGYDPPASGDHGYLHPPSALGERADGGQSAPLSESSARIAALDSDLGESFHSDGAGLDDALVLYRVYQPRVSFFRFASIDLASHRFWQHHETRYLELAAMRGRPVAPEVSAAFAQALPGAYAYFDEWLGQLMGQLPEGTTMLIVSDHGFRGVDLTDYLHVDLNALLSRVRWLARTADGSIDWSRTRAFALEDLGGLRRGIYLNVKGREERGILAPADVPSARRRLARALTELRTHLGEPVFRAVTLTERTDRGEPDISVVDNLSVDPRGTVTIGGERAPVTSLYRRYSEDFGTHDPAGIMLAAGGGIVQGRRGWNAELYDVAPTILCLLGLPQASDMPGRPVGAILSEPPAPDASLVPTYGDLVAASGPVRRPAGTIEKEMRLLRLLSHL